MNQTTNYQLPQWEADDRIMRTDFNGAFSAIDTAMNALSAAQTAMAANLGSGGRNCRIASGIYTGTGTGGWEHPNMLEVSFKPVLILIRTNDLNGVYQHSPTVFFYPHSRARSDAMYDQDSSKYLLVQWPADNLENPTYKVYWRTTADTPASVAPLWQNNVSGQAYFYIIIGYEDN